MLSDNDIKEELSHIYIHAAATCNAYSIERTCIDRDSIDTEVCAKGKVDRTSIIMSPKIGVQLKATSQEIAGDNFPFPLSIKNYNELRAHTMVPRILVVFTLPQIDHERLNFTPDHLLLKGKAYWLSLANYEDTDSKTSKTIYIPTKNVFDDVALRKLMIAASKREAFINEK